MFAQLLEIPARYPRGQIFFTVNLEGVKECKASVYMLDTPYAYEVYNPGIDDYEMHYAYMVIASSIQDDFVCETLVFPCDATGTLSSWDELTGTNTLSHEDVLAQIDYLICKQLLAPAKIGIIMRLSRPCYDKFHRCPGWAGGGFKYPKVDKCTNGYIKYGKDYTYRIWEFGHCSKCDVIVFPNHIRYIDATFYKSELLWKIQKIKWAVQNAYYDWKS